MSAARKIITAAIVALGLSSPGHAATGYDLVMSVNNDGASLAPAGGSTSWSMTVTNDGPLGSDPVVARLRFPAGLGPVTVGTVSGFTSCSYAAPEVVCSLPAMPSDATASVAVSATANALGVMTVSGSVVVEDDQTSNNSDQDSVTVQEGSDLALSITSDNDVPSGSVVSITLGVINNGPHPLQTGTVSTPLVAGLTNLTYPSGCAVTGSDLICQIGPLAVGASASIPLTGKVSAAGSSTVTIVSSAAATSPRDGNPDNSTRSASIRVLPGSDLAVAKDREPASPMPVGDRGQFVLRPTYTGDAPGPVTLTDDVPANYQVLGVTAPGWSCAITGNRVLCSTPGTGVAGSLVSLGQVRISVEARTPGAPVNVATISTSAGNPLADPDRSNDQGSDGGTLIVPAEIDLAASKTGPSPAFVTAGQTYPFSLRAANAGNVPYEGTVRITEFVPEGLTITGISGAGWSCDAALPVTGPASILCERAYTETAPLGVGQYAPVLVMEATSTADGALRNRMRVDAVDGNLPDEKQGNNEAAFSIRGNVVNTAADLRVGKTASASSVVVGQPISFDITVSNAGPGVATDVEVTDELVELLNTSQTGTDAGITLDGFVRNAPAGGTCSVSAASDRRATLTCLIPELPPTAATDSPVIRVTVRPGHNDASRNNAAYAISRAIADPDYANNEAVASYSVEPRVDLSVSKVVRPETVGAGQAATWSITAANRDNDLSSAVNVRVRDDLPHDLTIVSVTPSGDGTCSVAPAPGSVTGPGNDALDCVFPQIPNGAQQTVLITARPGRSLRGTNVVNTASVVSDVTDLNPDDHSATASLAVTRPVLDLIAGLNLPAPIVPLGDSAVWEASARNAGPSAAENVILTLDLPAGVPYRGVSGPGSTSCSSAPVGASRRVTCHYAYLPAGQTVRMSVVGVGAVKGVHQGTVSVSSDEVLDGHDENPSNNEQSRNLTVRTRVNLGITKAPSVLAAGVTEPFNWVIELTNPTGAGLSEAEGVRISDTLPSGLSLAGPPVVSPISGGSSLSSCLTQGSTGFLCDLGEVASGSVIRITVPVVSARTLFQSCPANAACAPVSVTNRASVTTTSIDTDSSNNSATGTVSITSSTVSGKVFRDFNGDGASGPNDTPFTNQRVTLTGTSGPAAGEVRTVMTNASGQYVFSGLPAGAYKVSTDLTTVPFVKDLAAHPSNGASANGAGEIVNVVVDHGATSAEQDFSAVPMARIGVAKRVSAALQHQGNGVYRASYSVVVQNLSLEPLVGVSVTDVLTGALPRHGVLDAALSAPGTYRVRAISASPCGVNAAYDGSASTNLLAAGVRLTPAQTCTVQVQVDLRFPGPLPASQASTVRYENQAVAEGQGEWSGQTFGPDNPYLRDASHTSSSVGANPENNNSPTPLTYTATPRIEVSKRITGTSFTAQAAVGDTITYGFTVRNTGNVPLYDVTIADANAVVTGGPVPVLQPAHSSAPAAAVDSTTFTATHTITSADITAGRILNRATASGSHAQGRTTSAQSLNETGVAGNTELVLGGVSVIKTASAPVKNHVPGDVITFNFAVTNSGASELRDVVLTDDLPGVTLSASSITSIPAKATRSVTGTYALTQEDVDRGFVDNGVSVTGSYGQDGSGNAQAVTAESEVRVPLTQAPSVALAKTGAITADEPASAGDPVVWTFTVRNTGNVTLSDITLSDPDAGSGNGATIIGPLAPGEERVEVWTLTRPLTQAEVDAGRAVNSATVSAKTPGGATVTDMSGPTLADDAPTVVPISQEPALSVSKTLTSSIGTAPAAGDEAVFEILVRNEGNVTLTGVTVSDALPGVSLSGANGLTLAPAGEMVITARYGLTQADIDAGSLLNEASAVATAPGVSGPARVNGSDTEEVALPAAPDYEVRKADVSAIVDAGEPITWGIEVENTGNVTLTDVRLTDDIAALSADSMTLAPGETVSLTATATATQAMIDAGTVLNTVRATYAAADGEAIEREDAGTATLGRAPSVALVKEANVDALSAPPRPGDLITYEMTATNTGNVTLTSMTLTDALAGAVITDAAHAEPLAPGAEHSWTATYALTQADIDAGGVVNEASVAATSDAGPASASASVSTPIGRALGVTLAKAADTAGLSSPPVAGDEIGYAITLTNTGNVTITEVDVDDPLITLTGDADALPLAPGLSAVWRGSYALTQADIEAGRVVNLASADVRGGGNEETATAEATVPLARAPAMTVRKTVSAALSDPAAAGDRLTYQITVLNSGNVALTGVQVEDPLPGLTLTSGAAAILPGESSVWTGTYALTQADVDRGFVLNEAAATADSVAGPATGSAQARQDVPAAPSVETVKTADLSGVSSPAVAGQIIAYEVAVTNTGNVTLSGVTVADPLPGLTLSGGQDSLAPGESAVWRGDYVLTQADVDAGRVENTATASGTHAGVTVSDADTVIVSPDRQPQMTLTKAATAALSSPPRVGDAITYELTVRNTGNVTLKSVAVSDPLPGLTLSGGDSSLDPGEEAVWTGAYALTQADVDRGFVDNEATAESVAGPGEDLTVRDDVRVSLDQAPGLSLVKTMTGGVSDAPRAGDEIGYSVLVTNTGNVTVSEIEVIDPLLPLTGGNPVLAPGESAAWTGTYALTQADVDAGVVNNEATATGGFDGAPVSAEDAVSTPLAAHPNISVSKTATPALSSPPAAGDLIAYEVRARNEGNVSLTAVSVEDPLIALTGGSAALAPGEEAVWTGTYALTQADVDAGRVLNTASASALFGSTPVTGSDEVAVEIAAAPAITLTKTADASGVSDPAQPGDRVSYDITVRNAGNVTLTSVAVADALPGLTLTGGADALAPGEEAIWTGEYALAQADVDAGEVINTASVTGEHAGVSVSDEDAVTVPLSRAPAISAVKSATPSLSSPPRAGDRISYEVLVTNTGNTSLSAVSVQDPLPGLRLTGGKSVLSPGESALWEGEYALTQADVDAGRVVNTATATGQSGAELISAESGVSVPLDGAPRMIVVKDADASSVSEPARAGQSVRYAITVTNDGNLTLTDISVRDPMPGLTLTGGADALLPGESAVWVGEHVLTQAEIDAGVVENTASVTAASAAGEITGEASASVPLTASALVELDKSYRLTTPGDRPAQAGDEVRVIYLITNTGTSTLTGVTLTDPAGVSFSPDIPDLAPGESWTVEGSYVITQADIDAGLISGPAEVSANGAGGAVSDDAMAELRLDRAPSIVLVKTADASGVSTPAEAGQRITYGFTVRNSGNVTLTNVRLTDDMPGLVLDAPVIRSLAPGESSSAWTAVRVITEADFENGDLRNTATGTGEAPGGGVVSDVSGATEGDDSPTVVRITPPTDQELVMTKRANLSTAKAGDVITYTITLRNDASYSATRVRVVDSLPRGLSYQPGSAAVAGTGAEPNVSGRSLSWAGLTVPGNSEIVITLRAAVTSTELGKLVNEAWAEDRDGRRISNKAEATVRIEPEHVFDCSDVFGKVFVDADGDRRQDKGERGVGGVRLRTLDGLIITTDEHGRYSVPCAALPKSVGSNHLVKIDETSLPAGLSLSGDASRTVRVTPGRAAKLNFELSQAREVEMRVSQRALGRPELRAGIAKVMRALDGRPATFKVVWERAPGESGEAVREGLGEVSRLIRAEAGKAGVRATVRTGSVKR